jgi:DNA-damage-inducible protein D
LAIFKGKKIRWTIYKNEWWFSIVDIVEVLTDSAQPSGYIKDMCCRDPELSKGWGQIATTLSIETTGGKQEEKTIEIKNVHNIDLIGKFNFSFFSS